MSDTTTNPKVNLEGIDPELIRKLENARFGIEKAFEAVSDLIDGELEGNFALHTLQSLLNTATWEQFEQATKDHEADAYWEDIVTSEAEDQADEPDEDDDAE